MHWIDILIFALYFIAMMGVGFYFYRKNDDLDDYYVGGRNMGSAHIGLSVVATDVGGGFSIGLGGLGFLMGVSGSWMLFTGLIGAWLSAVFLIPKVVKLGKSENFHTFPQIFGHYYNADVALIAGIISGIGYIGFTSSQILAGAKLASATIEPLSLDVALIVMGIIVVGYTVMGGIKAVIYTDTIQWAILMGGLVFIGIPICYTAIGGIDAIRATVPPEMLQLTNITWQQCINWAVTIIPIWFVGMTLYQRIFASRDEKTAKRAWFIAGLFEWPIMAFMGVLLGLFARVALEQGMFASMGYTSIENMDAEMGLPVLLKMALPVGFMGLMLSAYFSAIMSTADSCLMAASGNILSDVVKKIFPGQTPTARIIEAQGITLLIGILGVLLATYLQNVLELMLYSYAFMVSGLFVPILGGLYLKNPKPAAALVAMVLGGTVTLTLIFLDAALPFGLDANIFGITASAVSFGAVQWAASRWS